MGRIIHVATDGNDEEDGTDKRPYRSISRAAEMAFPGDTVLVRGGVYREWIRPRRGGTSDQCRISYVGTPGERVIVKGSEEVTGWERVSRRGWHVRIPNWLFGQWNPFREVVGGDWLVEPIAPYHKHLGAVYMNGVGLYEVESRDAVEAGAGQVRLVDHWTGIEESPDDARARGLVWYAEVGNAATELWANFGDADPNGECVEVTVRKAVLFPERTHRNFITVRGFEFCQAATPWAPPTAEQIGMIGPHWAKGWIIEDCIIYDATCVGISLGKEASTGENWSTERGDKPGYQYQLEATFRARQSGWDREHIGSHVVRRNRIYRCGQSAIAGNLGAVFSRIEDNDIFDIGRRREFYGHEIAGIKLHAAIDVSIVHNRIHNCSLGIWLDWQAQGTRVARNICYGNRRDLFIEVCHGPYVVDHNLLLSPVSIESFSQGGAYVNNCIGGVIRLEKVLDRSTPYHVPHSTQVSGLAVVYGGDDRYLNNLFIGGEVESAYHFDRVRTGWWLGYGTVGYEGHPTSLEEYVGIVAAQQGSDLERYVNVPQPVYINGNVYANGAEPFSREEAAVIFREEVAVGIAEEGGHAYLLTTLPESFGSIRQRVVEGRDLPRTRLSGGEFEASDGDPIMLDVDLVGEKKDGASLYAAGPVARLGGGTGRLRVW